MDFKRIEAIFLVAFLCLDIFLFSIYRQSQNEQTPINNSSTIKITQRLKEDKIKYEGKISSEHTDGYYLSATQTNLNTELQNMKKAKKLENVDVLRSSVKDNLLSLTPEKDLFVNKKGQIPTLVRETLTNQKEIILGKDYRYQDEIHQQSDGYLDVYACQKYEGIPINDITAQIKFTLKKNDENYRLEKIQQMHLSNLTALREKMPLVSEEDALTTLYINNKLSKNDEILWSKLAYTLVLQVRGKNVYVPAWFVSIRHEDKKEQVEIVNAFRNRIITNAAVRKVENK
ncbi:two-component system regulatory protein YycI [Enterococcus cecorum]|uniref:Two-component system regulatory protein YycI n=1 Tax=Enterococcus cecorum TaxID=44008 RepID=A0AAW9JK88_9ENTE|nr:two-component system regulatory protein YycI [Enterococcus cecorum]HJD15246.1 two-component system regulatory protein YycI [Candidatus Enterococcus stercoripullorum]HLQ86916.1 two-component system regulatory protein YycI [Enterococcus sp.]MCJ0544113.1 two-component system regulatory protein YycI [Enterococcus cecorum]MCJ0548639.1 two-component system regulatory protein YycI [Enterococcus cecorum]MCJ0605355.1 two-component system regulatory protein YycI [Enterococcus cecorum]